MTRYLKQRPCSNCGVCVYWGVLCIDCVRAFATGAGIMLTGWAVDWWLR